MDNVVRTDLPLPQTVQPPAISSAKTQKSKDKAGASDRNAVTENVKAEPSESKAQESRTQENKAQEETAQDQEKYTQTMAQKAVDNANQRVHKLGTSARFEYNKEINRITITISDRESGDVIREVPPEQTQKMLERIHTMTGMLMDTEA